MAELINPNKPLIFRIVHRDNLSWIFDNGLHCRNSGVFDPNYVSIGNAELIDRRRHRRVEVPPGGTLSDYVPFYFTPHSPMLLNISTGYGGVTRRSNCDIVVVVSSLSKLRDLNVPFLFTDRHAYLTAARFFGDPIHLNCIDWQILKDRDFKRNHDDPGKFERYQAEALVHRKVPTEALVGIACFDEVVASSVKAMSTNKGLQLHVVSRPGWYFP